MSTKLTLETRYGRVEVEVKDDDLALPELMDLVVVPVLRGTGFAESTINECTGTEL